LFAEGGGQLPSILEVLGGRAQESRWLAEKLGATRKSCAEGLRITAYKKGNTTTTQRQQQDNGNRTAATARALSSKDASALGSL
jgi:hypothetical protein